MALKDCRKPQVEALAAVKADYVAGMRRVILAIATGVGKTVIFSHLYEYMNLGGQMIVLAHRDELIKQAVEKMKFWNPSLKIGIEMGQKYYADLDCDVIVASVQTLGREGTARIARFDPDKVKIVVVDECHHSVADTYLNVFNHFGMFDEGTDKLLLGVTATTGRGDGQGLSKVYQKVSYHYSMKQAIEDGWLSDVRALRVRTDTSLDKVKSRAGDFALNELADTVNTPGRNQQIVKAWLENAKERPTVAFCVDIQHSKDLAEMFRKFGVKAAAVWGDDPERAWKLACHQGSAAVVKYCVDNELPIPLPEQIEGELLDVVTNCDVLTEGYDDWRIACVIMGRPTKSQTAFVQRVGRGTRLQNGIGNLKEAIAAGYALSKRDCLVLDVVDSLSRNSLVTVPSIFGLNAEMDLKGKSAFAAVKAVEAAQIKNPEIDFSKLESLDQIKILVDEMNIWEVKFPDEVVANSKMTWHRAYDGSFTLQLPNDGRVPPRNEKITIRQNVMDQWEIKATINDVNYKGVRGTIEEAFVCGDNLLVKVAGDTINVLSREAAWHDDAATEGQLRRLKRLLKGKPIPANVTKGKASQMIGRLIAEMVTGEPKAKKFTTRKKAA